MLKIALAGSAAFDAFKLPAEPLKISPFLSTTTATTPGASPRLTLSRNAADKSASAAASARHTALNALTSSAVNATKLVR
jgi:hypothetical protein